jgi:DNA gyrase subunit A
LGNCYTLPVSKLEEGSRPKDRGLLLSGVLNGLETNEQCVAIYCTAPGDLQGMPDFIFYTAQGLVKRAQAGEYDVRRSKFAAIGLKDDALQSVSTLEEGADQFCLSRQGMMIRFSVDDIPPTGRASRGVRAIKLSTDDSLAWAGNILNTDQLILFSERGYAKRVLGSMADAQNRGGRGVHAFSFNRSGSNGCYVAAFARLAAPRSFSVLQLQGELTPFYSDDIVGQTLGDRGKPYVMALLDNVVTDIIL